MVSNRDLVGRIKAPRLDIQALRALAVSLVVLYHANLIWIPAGFLGVDIFFVISGYLITSHLLRDLEAQRFSFINFYSRRARRLLPAAFCTLLITTILANILLTPSDMRDYYLQLLGSLTFSANLVLPLQTGYFGSAAAGKPLLHMWSLSLEEQYYFLVPLALWACYLTPLRRLLGGKAVPLILATGVVLSFGVCLYLLARAADWAFYFPLARFWEMLCGSLAAWVMMRRPGLAIPSWLKIAAALVIVLIPFQPLDLVHPRIDALIVVLATSVLVMGENRWLAKNRFTASAAKIGDWSYSIYLVHWPLFAFAYVIYLGQVPYSVRLGLFLLAPVLGFIQCHLVERPFLNIHDRQWPASRLIGFSSFALLCVAVALALAPARADTRNFLELYRPTKGLGSRCDSHSLEFVIPSECEAGSNPTVAVWGDSYAMHLVPGIVADPRLSKTIVQITRSACSPIKGVSFLDSARTPEWAEKCIDFNSNALSYLREHKEISTVVLGMALQFFLDDGRGDLSLFYRGEPHLLEISPVAQGIVEIVDDLRHAGKTVIIVAPTPTDGSDIGACVEREAYGLITLGHPSCDFPIAAYNDFGAGQIATLRQVERVTQVQIVWPSSVICPAGTCNPVIDGASLYRDRGHLTSQGSVMVVRASGLADMLASGLTVKAQ